MEKSYVILQLKKEFVRDLGFCSLSSVKNPDLNNYEEVYRGSVIGASDYGMLENLFCEFNTNHPADFKGHSLSVSDIVRLDDGDNYYCDIFGWQKL